jgi:hypothetical protein
MADISPEHDASEPGRKESEPTRNAGAEGARIANIASQLSPEDLEQLRRYIDRHHPKLFQ